VTVLAGAVLTGGRFPGGWIVGYGYGSLLVTLEAWLLLGGLLAGCGGWTR